MPFLIPAVVALISDVSIIWLNRLSFSNGRGADNHVNDYDMVDNSTFSTSNTSSTSSEISYQAYEDMKIGDNDSETFNETAWFSIYNVRYLAPIAGIRLILLIIPLLFHSYTGTAVNYMIVYKWFYSVTLLVVLIHMISLALMNPTSMEAFLPDDIFTDHGKRISTADILHRVLVEVIQQPSHYGRILLEHVHELRRIWWMLTLSLLATVCHWILLWHVRSTAPTNNTFFNGNFKRPSVYFAVRTASTYAGTNIEHLTQNQTAVETRTIVNEQAMMKAMNEFVIEMNCRLQRAKAEWASRLEDFGNLLSNNNGNVVISSHPSLNMEPIIRSISGGSMTFSNSLTQQQPQQTSFFPGPVQPFRILLQLFAYEDVLENHKLDSLFDLDDGETATFFVPQLLSFLLHGALYSSPLLEEWILDKCRRNVYFAHRCYWFLRAWCLEAPADVPLNISIIDLHKRNSSNQSLDFFNDESAGLTPFLDEPASNQVEDDDFDACNTNNYGMSSPISSMIHVCNPTVPRDTVVSQKSSSRLVLNAPSSASLQGLQHNDKFIPEERAMIERLMMRVKECGQVPARCLEYGQTLFQQHCNTLPNELYGLETTLEGKNVASSKIDDTFSEGSWEDLHTSNEYKQSHLDKNHNDSTKFEHEGDESFFDCRSQSPDATILAVESGQVPIDPISGNPSVKHLQALTSEPTYGFLPVKSIPLSTLGNDKHSTNGTGATEQFDKTPQFLDALIFLAEHLHSIPREERKAVLVQQLRTIECELLPSNAIYLPLGSNRVHHSVWRIAAEESIPISTKERVPCIIALEVVDFIPELSVCNHENILQESANKHFSVLDSIPGSISNNRKHASQWDSDRNERNKGTKLQPQTSPFSSPFTSKPILSFNDNELPEAYNNGHIPPDSDSKILYDWVHKSRPPFRRISLLDKVATSVKAPFDKMKTQVRDHILNNLRVDRKNLSTAEEMQPLSLTREFESDDSLKGKKQGLNHLSDVTVFEVRTKAMIDDLEASWSKGNRDSRISPAPSRSLSRMGSDGSIVSLGQWSPHPNGTSQRGSFSTDQVDRKKLWNELRRRLDDTSKLPPKPIRRNSGSQLPYGSDHEDDAKEARKASTSATKRRMAMPLPKMESQQLDDRIPKQNHRPPPVVFRESWANKEERIRKKSAFGNHPGWKLLPILIKANDDLRQEQLACQLIQRMASILAHEKINVWLYPYEILALTQSGGIIEAIPDTISLDSLKKNGGSKYTNLNGFFLSHFGEVGSEELANAKANFVESLAAYSIVCFLLQIKDRHNGNILLDNKGHLIHIDFGFFFLSSPGKNVGFESAPFKLTREFIEILDNSPDSHLFRTYRSLCIKTFIALRRRCMEIILLVEMLKVGNEELPCFRGRPDEAIQQLRERFRLDLNDRACAEYVNSLIDASTENWRTDWYDRYQRYFVGIL